MQPPGTGPGQWGSGGFVPPPGGAAPWVPSAPDGAAHAKAQVAGPAIGIMVASGLSLAWWLLCIGVMLFAGGLGLLQGGAGADPMAGLLGGILGAAVYGFFAIAALVALIGAARMKSLKSYSLSFTAAIIATLPCTTYVCCFLMMPFGIWALVVLLKPEVKAEFR